MELTLQLRDLMKVVRQLKQQRDGLPAGTVGLLLTIDQLTGRDESCHAKELARHSGLDQSTVSRAVAALAGLGLVERVPDPTDKRASILAVTAAGRTVLTEAQDWFERVLAGALREWRADEIAVLTASLGRFVADLDRALRNNLMETAK